MSGIGNEKEPGPFDSEQHPVSRRWAVMEDDGRSAWLYLTAPDTTMPVASCFLYNRAEAQDAPTQDRGDTPVVPARYLVSTSAHIPPDPGAIHFQWSSDGETVAVLIGDVLMGFIAKAEGYGFSKLLRSAGPFGSPLDISLFNELFVVTDDASPRKQE